MLEGSLCIRPSDTTNPTSMAEKHRIAVERAGPQSGGRLRTHFCSADPLTGPVPVFHSSFASFAYVESCLATFGNQNCTVSAPVFALFLGGLLIINHFPNKLHHRTKPDQARQHLPGLSLINCPPSTSLCRPVTGCDTLVTGL